jgi:hypothetical protein
MLNYFNKVSKKLSNYLKHDEELDNTFGNQNIEDCLIYLNSQIVIWKEEKNFDDDNFNQIFSHRFNNKFLIYNLLEKKINFESNFDKIIDFKAPNYPSYTLEFLLTFAISVKNWLSLDSYNILIVHDDLKNPRVLSLLSTVLSYLNKNSIHPMDLYANIITTNKSFAELANVDAYKNITRYINYFSSIQNNPIFEYKKLFLKSIFINGAPAIDNLENDSNKSSHYITINDKSFYKPVIRIISNDKNCYCSYKK